MSSSSMIGQGTNRVKSQSALISLLSSDQPACAGEGLCPSFTSCPSSCSPPSPAPSLPIPADLRRPAAIKAPHPTHILRCPRCDSPDTKFCYYNNYSLSQPRYFCKNCKRYWTSGGTLRNVPVGGGLRKNKRSKLKLQAEAEAAAAAAAAGAASRDYGAVLDDPGPQLRHLYQDDDGKPLNSPVLASSSTAAAAIGRCNSTSGKSTSSVVSGIPAKFDVATTVPPPSFHSSGTTAHLMRTSSGSDGSTIEYAGNDNCSSTAGVALPLMDRSQQINGRNQQQLQPFVVGDDLCARNAAAASQFYPSNYSTSLQAISDLQQRHINAAGSSINEQNPGSAASYEAMGYLHHQLQLQGSISSLQVLGGSNEVAGLSPPCANNYSNGVPAAAVPYSAVISSNAGGDACSNDQLQQKEELISSNSHYDWQSIPDNLFNGAPAEGFLPLPWGSWPDFLQFQDPSGPV